MDNKHCQRAFLFIYFFGCLKFIYWTSEPPYMMCDKKKKKREKISRLEETKIGYKSSRVKTKQNKQD